MEPRAPPLWDSGSVHEPTIHRIPGGTGDRVWALFYMGSANTWDAVLHGRSPNCTRGDEPEWGDTATRRIGLATSSSLWGPWQRRDAPLLGPGQLAEGEWDHMDVSNAAPLFLTNGTVVLLYKGRGACVELRALPECQGRSPHQPWLQAIGA